MLKLSSVYGKSSNLEVRGVLDERCPHTTGSVHVDDLDVDCSEPGNMFRYASEETSHALDANPRGMHVDRKDFDVGAEDSGSRVMSMRTPWFSCLRKRVADVRKSSIADGFGQRARFS